MRAKPAKPAKVGKERLDKLLVARGLCETRSRAQALIVAGKVVVGDHAENKPGTAVPVDAPLRIKGEDHGFVSRGGLKLQGALEVFSRGGKEEEEGGGGAAGLDVRGRVAMDVGASTGGFTDCLLKAGVAKVYAIDVGYGQLAWRLAQDPRVINIERQNIRTLPREAIPEAIELVVIDCSFISLTKVLSALPSFLAPAADVVALIKPQFEVGREAVGKGGIVRDPAARRRAQEIVEAAARELGFVVRGVCDSPIRGQKGNLELLIWLTAQPR
ncbi:MAG: TlyA family RNA methyltransferase [Myxococcales bacterium]|nr:TlyA family RNA methyltransferase [Myxococcales bacterium]